MRDIGRRLRTIRNHNLGFRTLHGRRGAVWGGHWWRLGTSGLWLLVVVVGSDLEERLLLPLSLTTRNAYKRRECAWTNLIAKRRGC